MSLNVVTGIMCAVAMEAAKVLTVLLLQPVAHLRTALVISYLPLAV